MAEQYRVTIWDKKVNDPYYVLEYDELETAQFVARSMQRHYIDDWGEHGQSIYEVRLQRMQGESND